MDPSDTHAFRWEGDLRSGDMRFLHNGVLLREWKHIPSAGKGLPENPELQLSAAYLSKRVRVRDLRLLDHSREFQPFIDS